MLYRAFWLATSSPCWRGRERWRPLRRPRLPTHPLSSETAMPLQSLLPTPCGAPAPTSAAPTDTACNCAIELRFVRGGPRQVFGRRRRSPGGETHPEPDFRQLGGYRVLFDSCRGRGGAGAALAGAAAASHTCGGRLRGAGRAASRHLAPMTRPRRRRGGNSSPPRTQSTQGTHRALVSVPSAVHPGDAQGTGTVAISS